MIKARSGTTAQLVQLCLGYFVAYVLTGILVKYFTVVRSPKMSEMAYLFNNTLGGSAFPLLVVLLLGWVRLLQSNRTISWAGLRMPAEVAYIVPSGICTAVVIPTTTLMYSLPISVMVAMVIMRGSVIVISRVVDELQIRQGILKKRVYHEENLAVLFALLAVATNVLLLPLVAFLDGRGIKASAALGLSASALKGSFDFIHSAPALVILGLYITAYAFRIYIMNYYKNTRSRGVELDNRGFFAVEQIAACVTMVALGGVFVMSPGLLGWKDQRILDFSGAALHPDASAILAGLPYGLVAFFSVFIFMFKGRTATFAGLVNRLTSLLAGTAATLLTFYLFKLKLPSLQDWLSVGLILVAVYFLTRAERRRAAELGLAPAPATPLPGPATPLPARPPIG